jgi:hypothetical protein
MKSKQIFYLLLAVLVVLGACFFAVGYGANKLLVAQAAQLSKLKADSQIVDITQASLNKNKKDIAKYSSLNKIAQTIVPQDKDQAVAVREIVNLASQSGINRLSSITFPASSLGTLMGGVVGGTSKLTQVVPVKGISGVYDLPISVSQDSSSTVSYSQLITFIQKLEQNRRTAQVSSISIEPAADHPNQVAFTLTIDEFIKP